MGWLDTVINPTKYQALYKSTDDFWYNPIHWGPHGSATGYPASPEAALHVSAYFNGVMILAQTLAQPPLIYYERVDEDTKEVARGTRLYEVLHNEPNDSQSSYDWRVQGMTSVVMRGNWYNEIIPSARSPVDKLEPLLTQNMTPQKLASGRVGYMYRQKDGTPKPYTQDEIFHVRGFPLADDGITGLSAIHYGRETIGLALAMESFGATLFKNGAMHRGNYTVPGSLTDEQHKQLTEWLKAQTAGPSGWHNNLILANGAKWENTGMSAEDAQFLLSRKFEVTEVARWLNIPPHKLKDLDRATNNNIEFQGLEWLQDTMLPHFVNWEHAIKRSLIVQKNRFFAEFLVDGLVRADIASRYNAYATGVNTGFMTRNQVRTKENWNTIPGLDQPLVDQNKAIVDKKGNIIPVNKPETQPGKPDVRRAPAENGNGTDEEESAHYRRLFLHSAGRVARKEAGEVFKALARHVEEPEQLSDWADKFYEELADYTAREMQIGEKQAKEFAEKQKDRLLLSVKDNCAGALLKEIETEGADGLVDFVREHRNGKETQKAA